LSALDRRPRDRGRDDGGRRSEQQPHLIHSGVTIALHGLEVTGRRGHVHDGTLDRSRGAGVVEEPELLNTADVIVFVATTNAERARAF